jgi:hypothetical protein
MATARRLGLDAQESAAQAKILASSEYERHMADAIASLAEAVSKIGLKIHQMD